MTYQFADFEIDTAQAELRAAGVRRPVEPQVFALLRLLVEHRHRLVSKDEIIHAIWGGRIVSDSALSSRVKSARQALGDDGVAQRWIRTHHGQGFRFVGEVAVSSPAVVVDPMEVPVDRGLPSTRPSIAVLPFSLEGAAGAFGAIADALPHDLIVELSRLRWLFVVARGSSFQFRGASATPQTVRAALGVRYCLSGAVGIDSGRLIVTVELCDGVSGGVVWAQRYSGAIDAVHEIREEIARSVVGALELQIPLAEGLRALTTPDNLDAWAAYHLGLSQMYRFDREGTERAARLFEQAISRDPTFARAHAGLSFAQFEGAFLRFATDRKDAARVARRHAERSLELDPLDPFCNLMMGRAAWLTGDLEGALPWLDRATSLNPSYAQGQYSSAWTRTLLGEGDKGRALVDGAMGLSPLDPLLYGMLGVRAFSHMVQDEPAQAAEWGERAARAPRAHALIDLIAAVGHGLNQDDARAQMWVTSARARQPRIGAANFLEAFPFREPAVRDRIERTLRRLSL